NAVEVKDLYTRGHSENVMAYSVKIANALGLDEQLLETIKYGGLLHDIGKIGIGENILNKPGRLTEEEFEVIKFHPALGANIIQDVPYFRDIVPLVMHHHEFFDGRGYPDGLSGTEIPYGARILSVADAFEAMTSDRPYRKSLDINLAKNILIENKGTQFDPDIVDVFVKIIDLDLDYKYDERD
ncbi:MAG: HD-GYP domain-containing protein, partial [Fibrobacterota bacterium]